MLRFNSVDELVEICDARRNLIDGALRYLLGRLDGINGSLKGRGRGISSMHFVIDDSTLHLNVAVHDVADLQDILSSFAGIGVRRPDDDFKPFDCAETMTRLYFMRCGELRVMLHAELLGANCKRVQVGVEPKYEIACA